MTLRIKKFMKSMPKLEDPILIEGLPGIGNVGKVAVDFLVEELKAKKILEIQSFSFPHSVFIDEDNLVVAPTTAMYLKKADGRNDKKRKGSGKISKSRKMTRRDLLFLAGDVQPLDENGSYEYCYKILDMMNEMGCKEIITIGGIGLPEIPENPRIYCTGSSKDIIEKYAKDSDVNRKIYGIVGPIIGVTGLLVGLAKEKEINAVCLLAETYNHPLYLGMKGSQKILDLLNKRLDLDLDVKGFGKDIEEVEKAIMKRTKDLTLASKKAKLSRLGGEETSYIG